MAGLPVLDAPRLRLRPFTLDDAPVVHAHCADRDMARWTLAIPHPYEPGMAEAWIETHGPSHEAGTGHAFAIERKADGELVGGIDLRVELDNRCAEIGYAIYKPHWGRGYATEAARRLIEHGFDDLGLERIHAHHIVNNPASGRVLVKAGMRFEGRMARRVAKWGELYDIDNYAVLRPDARAAGGPPGMTTTTTPERLSTADVAELFPDLMAIGDADLRDRVAAVWSEAITTGCGGKGWTVDELRAVKFTLLAGDIDLRFIEHVNSCVKQCLAIADVLQRVFGDRVPVDRDVLVAGALLADVGKPLEYDRDASGEIVKGAYGEMLRHPFSGVAMCYKHGLPPEVMHMVATHSHEGDKVQRSIESIIFHHADFVDFDIAKLLGARAAKRG